MIDTLQWIANVLIAIMMPIVIWGMNHISSLGKQVSAFKLHVAEHYVQKPEIDKMSNDVAEIRRGMTEILKTLHEMKGQRNG